MPKVDDASVLTPPLKWHGGKSYLARRIVDMMPRHLHYVEPFAGGLAVLLERDPNDQRLWVAKNGGREGVSEVANDLNGELMNFWRVLQDERTFRKFQRAVQAIPISRAMYEYETTRERVCLEDPDYRLAVSFFVRARQSRAGTFKGFTSLTRSRTRRGINGNASEWLGAVEGLPAIHARLQPVVLECMDGVELIQREDTPDTLFYLDPSYLHSTRVSTDAYAEEMTEKQHAQLLDVLAEVGGKFMLSGYRNPLYDEAAERGGWNRKDFELPNHAAGGKTKRRMVESVWFNY